jgi:GR25 family glycosyltransferase involved in LPS biosynthesis
MDIFLINRDDRPERLSEARAELERQGLNAHRFSAIITSPGWVGCRLSHIALLESNKDKPFFTILEDDVMFVENLHDHIANVIMEMSPDWDALFLGASPQEPQERYSEHLYKLSKAWCMHAVMWHPRKGGAVEAILKANEKREIGKIDVFMSEKIMPHYNIFLTRPLICTQRQYKSDTCGRSDTSTIITNYNKYCL